MCSIQQGLKVCTWARWDSFRIAHSPILEAYSLIKKRRRVLILNTCVLSILRTVEMQYKACTLNKLSGAEVLISKFWGPQNNLENLR